MATEKVGIYRKWHGPVPVDKSDKPLPKSEWPRARPFRWAVRWFGSDGKRYSRSFKRRKEANKYAESRQTEIRIGKGDEPGAVTLMEFRKMYLDLRGDLAPMTKVEHARTLRFLNEFLDRRMTVSKITPLDARRFLAWYRKREYRGRTPAPATVNKVLRECKRIFREAVVCSLIRENPFDEMRRAIRRDILDFHARVLAYALARLECLIVPHYYHESRTHLSLKRNSPIERNVDPPENGKVIAIPQVGGLHHRYCRAAYVKNGSPHRRSLQGRSATISKSAVNRSLRLQEAMQSACL